MQKICPKHSVFLPDPTWSRKGSKAFLLEPNLCSCYRITWVCTPPTYWPIKQPVEHQGGKSSWIPMDEADPGWTSGYEVSRYLHWKRSSVPIGWVVDFKTVKDKVASLVIPVQDKKKTKTNIAKYLSR